MTSIGSLARIASLIGDPARAAICVALMDGRALTAGELARSAGVSPQTASGHLARLVDGTILTAVPSGRHRYFRIASPAIADAIEKLMGVAGAIDRTIVSKAVVTGPKDSALRHARVCYDHLAGEVAVSMADSLVRMGHIDMSDDGAAVTADGLRFLDKLGIKHVGDINGRNARFCRPCMDWSERRPHLAGWVGRQMLARFSTLYWVRREPKGRAIIITPLGVAGLKQHFGIG